MPELPEVETSRKGIEPFLIGQHIVRITVRNHSLRWPVCETIKQLNNEPVYSVQRRAKYLLLELSSGWLVIHLGMSGSLRILPEIIPPEKHDHIDMIMSNGVILRYTDPRRFGAWLWGKNLEDISQLKNMGPEPLSDIFDSEYLFFLCQGKKNMIKPLLMDNKIVVGVGNIYACESLFYAKISPQRIANTLTFQETDKLVLAIKSVLKKAIEQGGTTLKDFSQSDGKPGYFAQELYVYGRKGQSCLKCDKLISTEKLAQRNTFFCPNCQK